MARKNIARVKLFDAVSLAADFTSIITDVDWLDGASIILTTAGVTDNTGTFTVEYRNKTSEDPNEQSAWQAYPGLAAALADSDDKITFRITRILESDIRVSFVAAGGTPDGTVTGFLNARQYGG